MDNSSSGMIELSQVTTPRGQFPVLSRFTLTISQGQFINLYGPTGCGKTTVLRLICGLADPTSGTVRVAGQDLSTLSSGARKRLRRSFGLFTRTALPSEDEALLQAITTPAILCGHSIRDAMMLAADALTVCGLFPLADNRIRDLSEGERQLALLAQSLVNKPAVILADEPTAYLDEEHADAALRILAQYASEGGTVLAVSHNPLSDTFVTAIDMEKLHHV